MKNKRKQHLFLTEGALVLGLVGKDTRGRHLSLFLFREKDGGTWTQVPGGKLEMNGKRIM